MKLGLTDLRDGAGFTQNDLGKKLSLDRKSVADLERKKESVKILQYAICLRSNTNMKKQR